MTGGWLLLRNHPERVMFGSLKNGFQTKEEYFSVTTAVITSVLNHNYINPTKNFAVIYAYKLVA